MNLGPLARAFALAAFVAVIAAAAVLISGGQAEPEEAEHLALETVLDTVYLWEGPAPNAKGDAPEDRPRMYITRPEPGKATGAAVIVCPGGGYGGRAMEHEGLQVCHWLNDLGVTAFLLAYRVRSAGYTPDDAFADAVRAVRFLRHHADDYGIDPKRIGMIGFSAGGHLISRVGLYHDAGAPEADDPVERESSRPDFLILCYTPTATGPWPEDIEKPPAAVSAATPPTFIFHTTEDMVDPEGVIAWYQALREAGVEAEMHIFGGYGPHGSGLSTGDVATGRWPELAAAWMRRSGFLTGKERASVEGTITIDGKPMYIGYVTFVPLTSEADPVACGMVSGWIELGKYRVPAKHGPAPGLHRVEVRHTALDPSAEPMIEDEALYTKFSPDDDSFMTVEIKPGLNVIDIAIATGAGGPAEPRAETSDDRPAASDLEVRIERLEPMRFASACAFSESPERDAHQKLRQWAEPRGLLADPERFPVYGFNNPMPSGGPRYGYEVWVKVGPGVEPEGEIRIVEFYGGLYAVTRCEVPAMEVGETWARLIDWTKANGYRPGHHQWLEKHLTPWAKDGESFVLELYYPIAE